jgi:hypothetical protein
MSADVLRPPAPAASRSEPGAPPPPAPEPALAIEPSLVNRLLGVAAAIFAVPVLLELRRLLLGAARGPTPSQEAWLLACSLALAAAFALALRRAGAVPGLRAARVLLAALALEATALGAALLAHVAL